MEPALSAAKTTPSLIFTETMTVIVQIPLVLAHVIAPSERPECTYSRAIPWTAKAVCACAGGLATMRLSLENGAPNSSGEPDGEEPGWQQPGQSEAGQAPPT